MIHAILKRLGVKNGPEAVQEALPRSRPPSRNHIFLLTDVEVDQYGNLPGGTVGLKRYEVDMLESGAP